MSTVQSVEQRTLMSSSHLTSSAGMIDLTFLVNHSYSIVIYHIFHFRWRHSCLQCDLQFYYLRIRFWSVEFEQRFPIPFSLSGTVASFDSFVQSPLTTNFGSCKPWLTLEVNTQEHLLTPLTNTLLLSPPTNILHQILPSSPFLLDMMSKWNIHIMLALQETLIPTRRPQQPKLTQKINRKTNW